MTQSITITSCPNVVVMDNSESFEADMTFGETLANISTLQFNIGNGAGWFDIVNGVNGVVAANLAPDGLSFAFGYASGVTALRAVQFRETVSGALSETVPYVSVPGVQVASMESDGPVQVTTSGQTIPVGMYGSAAAALQTGDENTITLESGVVGGQLFTILNVGNGSLVYEYVPSLTFTIPQFTAATFIWWAGPPGVWYPLTGTTGTNFDG